jgi:hypothetical protein
MLRHTLEPLHTCSLGMGVVAEVHELTIKHEQLRLLRYGQNPRGQEAILEVQVQWYKRTCGSNLD